MGVKIIHSSGLPSIEDGQELLTHEKTGSTAVVDFFKNNENLIEPLRNTSDDFKLLIKSKMKQ